MLGISTSLRSEISDSGIEVLEAILDLGGEAVELEYRITPSMLREIVPYSRRREMTVLSLHNFCPLPEGIPKAKASGDFFSLSALDKEERGLALRYTLRTLEWAEELGARAIVLHMGKIPMPGSMERFLELYDRKKTAGEEGQEFIREQKKSRARQGEAYLDAGLHSLDRLTREAEKRGVFLGIENRYNIHDLPNLEELKVLFRQFAGSPLRYWHDIGHATTQQNLGIESQDELLQNCGSHLIGVHLHGCKGYHDHEAPGSGEEDYALLKKFLKPETLRVVETHHRASKEELLRGFKLLKEQGIT